MSKTKKDVLTDDILKKSHYHLEKSFAPKICHFCGGSGEVGRAVCEYCQGEGVIYDERYG